MNEIYEEKRISLCNLGFYILRKWKVILSVVVGAFVITMAVGTFSAFFQEGKKEEETKIIESTVSETIDEGLAVKIQLIDEYKENIKEYDEYLKNSISIKLNPSCFYKGNIVYLLNGNSMDVLKAISLCRTTFLSEKMSQELAKELKESISPAFLQEALSFDERYYGMDDTKTDVTALIEINAIHYERSECEKMITFIQIQMDDILNNTKEYGEQISIENLSSEIRIWSDISLSKLSREIKNERAAAYDNYVSIRNSMSELERRLYETGNTDEEINAKDTDISVEEQNSEQKVSLISFIKWKYSILVMIGIIFLMGIFYSITYLLNGRVHTKEEMECYVKEPIIIFNEERKTEDKGRIDKAIDSLENSILKSSKNTLVKASALLGTYAKRENVRRIYFSSSCLKKIDTEGMKKLEEVLNSMDIDIIFGESVTENAGAFHEAMKCDCVVFWEKCNQSLEKNIREEIREANLCGLKVLGFILEV